ncbi:hypothetical protein SLEP1_g15684 [Rubroshorea leprosula]|uniref:Uncharacterized protein n=1 Tax=Rubroshorea leprosula TaxID=152421 RepID=A0AAV5IYP2_9ROSI|nr:hypothetical protein SLEP1_g15684 [Rubroshorea leprosula]
MRYFSGPIYKLLKTLETRSIHFRPGNTWSVLEKRIKHGRKTRSKHEEILKISSICTCQKVESGKAVLKVNPLDEQLAKKCFLAAEEQRKTTRGGTVGGFGWDTASVLDSLLKHGPSVTWMKVKENFRLVDLDKDETKDKIKKFVGASGNLAKSSDLEKLEVKIGNIETQVSEILKVLKKNGKPGADGEKRGGEVSVSESESDD